MTDCGAPRVEYVATAETWAGDGATAHGGAMECTAGSSRGCTALRWDGAQGGGLYAGQQYKQLMMIHATALHTPSLMPNCNLGSKSPLCRIEATATATATAVATAIATTTAQHHLLLL